MLSNALGIVVTILSINIVYVSFSTLRMILTLKGKRYLAALVSMFEVSIYILGLSIVLDNLSEFQNIVAYAVGFALGIIIGSKIEERLALGYITVNVISTNPDLPFTKKLREAGFGVTSWKSAGMDGERITLQVLAPRKQEVYLYKLVTEIDPKAFIVSYEPKSIQGGFWVKQIKKHTLQAETSPHSEVSIQEEVQDIDKTEQRDDATETANTTNESDSAKKTELSTVTDTQKTTEDTNKNNRSDQNETIEATIQTKALTHKAKVKPKL